MRHSGRLASVVLGVPLLWWCSLVASSTALSVSVSVPGLEAIPADVAGTLPKPQSPPQLQPTTIPAPLSVSVASLLQQPGCPVPTIPRGDFSATQVAYLVGELQQAITTVCYNVLATSLAVCLPDLSLSSGCCTPGCSRALRLVVSPECLAQFWTYMCTNNTYYAVYGSGVLERCLPIAAGGLQLTCPINETTMAQILSVGTEPGVSSPDMSSINISADPPVPPVRADQRDVLYYAECVQETPRVWPDFNGSLLFDSLLAFARDVPQDCLRTSLAYLPSCYDDLTYQTGCCSLRCRAALEKMPIPCLIAFLRSLCLSAPNLTKYFFRAAKRCGNMTLSCQAFSGSVPTLTYVGAASGLARNLPLIASSSGQCPLSQVNWPGYSYLTITTQSLRLVANISQPCRRLMGNVSANCAQELGIQLGCCSYQCALALRTVPTSCHNEFRRLLCREPEVAKYSIALADRCLGYSGYYECGQPEGIPPVAASSGEAAG